MTSVHKKEYKRCRDCSAEIGDADLYLKRNFVYCADDYMSRFGVDPSLTQSPERGSPEE